ncbi:MAG: response regulator [Cyclobacteriaceae bacterium]
MHKKTIAIVDDDQLFHWIVKKYLGSMEINDNVLSFFNGDEAYNYLGRTASEIPDIIMLDLNMPIADGWMFLDAFDKIKNDLEKSVKIFIVTSSIDEEDRNRAREYEDVADFISKPITQQILQNKLLA